MNRSARAIDKFESVKLTNRKWLSALNRGNRVYSNECHPQMSAAFETGKNLKSAAVIFCQCGAYSKNR